MKSTLHYTRSLIEAIHDPLITINTAGKIMDMNQALANITGISKINLTGTDFFDYFTEPQKAIEVYEEVFAKGFVADFPLTLKHNKGKLTDVLFNGSIFKDDLGNGLGVVIVARDVTEQKRITIELNEAKELAELARIIAEAAKSKAELSTKIAEDAVKAKQQFLSNMSHEIRTPMNAIIGFTKVILKTELTEKQKEYIDAIKLSGDALIVLINDILDLAKVDAGKMKFEQTAFRLESSISSMLHLFETKIQEKNIVLEKKYDKNIPNVLLGDPVRLHQIILNLVSNAVKFTHEGEITVSVQLLCENEESVTINFIIADTGIGIPESKILNIFENFQQATNDISRLYGGTGLGLAIVKKLVEAQNGTINVSSKIGEGSTFSFSLSFLKSKFEEPEEAHFPILEKEMKHIKVLVVEDIALNQLLMKTLLDDFGFERAIASNGRIAIEMLANNTFDIILMDLQMPEMNGFEATEYIRKIMKLTIPIIALTADVTTVDLAKCKAVGMNDYIAKPVDESILYSKLMGLVMKPDLQKSPIKIEVISNKKYTDLHYLIQRTRANKDLMTEMINSYLTQTPPLVSIMKKSYAEKDWSSLESAVHKIIPSFSIMGISTDFENMAKNVKEYAVAMQKVEDISDMVLQLEKVCTQACVELKE
jgi:PAS domain S-box-containing protein